MFHSSDLTQALDTPALNPAHHNEVSEGSDTGRLDIGPAFIETTSSHEGGIGSRALAGCFRKTQQRDSRTPTWLLSAAGGNTEPA